MKRFVVAAALISLGVGAAHADAISERKELMKGQAAATKQLVAIAKGEAAFDAAKVKELLQVYVDDAAKLPTLFPDDSKEGDTTASPKIWEDMEGFKAATAKFSADATAAMEAGDAAALGAALQKVTGNCQSCHEAFRVKKS